MCQKVWDCFLLKKKYKENALNTAAKYNEKHQFPGQISDKQN